MNSTGKNKWADGLFASLLTAFCLYGGYATYQAHTLMQDLNNNVEKYREALLEDFKTQCRDEKAEPAFIDRCAERRLETVLQQNKEAASQEGMANGIVMLASGIMAYRLFRREESADEKPRPPEVM